MLERLNTHRNRNIGLQQSSRHVCRESDFVWDASLWSKATQFFVTRSKTVVKDDFCKQELYSKLGQQIKLTSVPNSIILFPVKYSKRKAAMSVPSFCCWKDCPTSRSSHCLAVLSPTKSWRPLWPWGRWRWTTLIWQRISGQMLWAWWIVAKGSQSGIRVICMFFLLMVNLPHSFKSTKSYQVFPDPVPNVL